MRRIIALAAVCVVAVAGVGCKHVAGVCDCAHDPSNGELPTTGQAYPTVSPSVGAIATVEKMPAPMAVPEKMPVKGGVTGK